MRLWKEPVDSFLNAGVDLVPLVPLADVAEEQLPELVQKMADRINPLAPGRAAKLWTASYLLMGLRYPDDITAKLFEGIQAVKDSTTYQKILRDGRAEGHFEEARRIVLRQGTKRFGSPEAAVLAVLEGIRDINRLEDLIERSFDADVRDWASLLGIA